MRTVHFRSLADTVSAWFVPTVIAVAVATFFVWSQYGPAPRLAHALVNAVAVLIIACPCALGLTTPMSIMVGTGRGAEAGVLIRNAEALWTDVAMESAGVTLVKGDLRFRVGRYAVAWSRPPAFSADDSLCCSRPAWTEHSAASTRPS